MKLFEVTLTGSAICVVEAEDEEQAIEKADGLSRDELSIRGFSFDEDNDTVVDITDCKTPEQKAIRHLRAAGINISEEELRAALEEIAKRVV